MSDAIVEVPADAMVATARVFASLRLCVKTSLLFHARRSQLPPSSVQLFRRTSIVPNPRQSAQSVAKKSSVRLARFSVGKCADYKVFWHEMCRGTGKVGAVFAYIEGAMFLTTI